MGEYQVRDGQVNVKVIDEEGRESFDVDHMEESLLDDDVEQEREVIINKAVMTIEQVEQYFGDEIADVVRHEYNE